MNCSSAGSSGASTGVTAVTAASHTHSTDRNEDQADFRKVLLDKIQAQPRAQNSSVARP